MVGPVGVPVDARLSVVDIRTIPSILFLRDSADDSWVAVGLPSSSEQQEVVEAIPCDPLPIRYRRCCCFPRPRSHILLLSSLRSSSSHRVSARRKTMKMTVSCVRQRLRDKFFLRQLDNVFFFFLYKLLPI